MPSLFYHPIVFHACYQRSEVCDAYAIISHRELYETNW